MSGLIEVSVVAVTAFLVGAVIERVRLRHYWRRACTGFAWKRSVPNARKEDVRLFLGLFTEAFAFPESRRLCFSPSDKPLDVYKALYPFPKFMADAMELETFIESVKETFGVDLLPVWREDITLGELYAKTTSA